MKFTIDRFEGDKAIVELQDGSYAELLRVFLPDSAEGDIMEIIKLEDETNAQKEKIKSLMNKLFID